VTASLKKDLLFFITLKSGGKMLRIRSPT